MSIPGISDRNRLPRLGKIRLGLKVKNQNREYPKASEFFVFDEEVPELKEAFGARCAEIFPVLLPSDDENVFLPTARKCYGSTGLFCACDDGETAHRVRREKDAQGAAWLESNGLAVDEGEMFEIPCPGDDCTYFERKLCRNIGRLFIIIPDIPRLGVYEITTTSWNSMVNLLSYTRLIRSQLGTVAGVPFALQLKPQRVQDKEGKARDVRTLRLEFRGSFRNLLEAGKRIQESGAIALLSPAIEGGDPVPDDLMPHGGKVLDRVLEGGEPPKEEKPPKARPRRRGKAAKSSTRKEKPEAAPEKARQDQGSDDGPEELPIWQGKIKALNQSEREVGGKSVLVTTIEAVTGEAFVTMRAQVVQFASGAKEAGKEVRIEFVRTPGGLRQVKAIGYADEIFQSAGEDQG